MLACVFAQFLPRAFCDLAVRLESVGWLSVVCVVATLRMSAMEPSGAGSSQGDKGSSKGGGYGLAQGGSRRRRTPVPIFTPNLAETVQDRGRSSSLRGNAKQRADSGVPPRSRSSSRRAPTIRTPGIPPVAASAAEADPVRRRLTPPAPYYVDTVPEVQIESGMTIDEPRLGSSIPAWTPPLFTGLTIPPDVELSGEIWRKYTTGYGSTNGARKTNEKRIR